MAETKILAAKAGTSYTWPACLFSLLALLVLATIALVLMKEIFC
jgi:hypothetical protein